MVVEFDRPIARVQNILLRATYVLNELSEEEWLKELKTKLKEAFSLCPNNYDFRNIFLFLLLNSDADVIDVIAEDENFCHLVNTLPRLSHTLILRLILELDGFHFLREVIAFTPSPLSISVVEAFMTTEELHLTKLGMITAPAELSKGCFHKILLSDGEPAFIMEKFFNFFVSIQQYGYSCFPECYPCHIYNKEEKKGILYLQSLDLLSYIMNTHLPDQSSCWEGYLMGYATKFEHSDQINHKHRTVSDIIWECRSIVISGLNRLTRELTVDDWLSLAEVEFKTGTMQRSIGESIHKALEELEEYLNDPRLPDLPGYFEAATAFALKPEVPVNETESVSFEKIKEKLLCKESTNVKWMKGFLKHKNYMEDEKAEEIIMSNCNLLDEYDVECILEAIICKLGENSCTSFEKEKLKCLSYQAMKYLPLSNILTVQKNQHRKYEGKNDLCGSEFSAHLLEAFNKLTFQSVELAEEWQCKIIRLSILDPYAVVQKALQVGLHNTSSTKMISKTLRLLKPMSQTLVFEWVGSVSEECPFNRAEMDAFPNFTLDLIKEEMLCREQFLRSFVICGVHKATVSYNWDVVSMWIIAMQHVLNETVSTSGKVGSIAVLLVYMGQVLEYCQQTIDLFKLNCVHARDQALKIIHSLKCFELGEVEKDWFESYIKKYSGITLCQLAGFATVEHPAKANSDYRLCFNAQVKTPQFASYILVEMLPFLTVKEWCGIANALKMVLTDNEDQCYSAFQSFQQAIVLLIAACADLDLSVDSGHQSCLNYCVRCLGTILKVEILPDLKITNHLKVLEETLYLLSNLPNKVWNEGGMHILPVIVDIMYKIPPKLEALDTLSALITTCPINQSCELLEEKLRIVFRDTIDEVREIEINDR